MAVHYRTNGFVFKKTNCFEADSSFSVFTKDFGRVEISAKAIRKIKSKLRGGICLFSFSDIGFIQGKNQKTLTDASITRKFGSIFSDLGKNIAAHKMSAVTDAFIRGEEKDEQIFSLLSESFFMLDSKAVKKENIALVYHYFCWNMMALLGYCPNINECAICKKAVGHGKIFFSYKEGGLVCCQCANAKIHKQINVDFIKVLKVMLSRQTHILPRLKMPMDLRKAISEISNGYYSYIYSLNV